MKTALACLLAATVALSGCAALNSVSSDVSSFGEWPADRKAGSYAFERLPSQQANAGTTEALEAAAAGALKKAGFTVVASGQQPDVLVQVGARVGRADQQPWADPIWWRGGFGYYRHGPWGGPRWGMGLHFDAARYEREVAVLIRDRASGKPLFEARASNEGNSSTAGSATLAAMFEAALMDFPRLGMNPRRVVVQLPS
ncbi:MAG: DUF4136 domain-containing protein [Rubrivivax sp.]|nr:DUF4136 domain-containing protein [Rubrivivax sp.]MDP3615026.1 DUF4136 domain-containing protein [Rubrivivax sp.]